MLDKGIQLGNLISIIGNLPKVLLHTHLEGSIPQSTLVKLSKRNKIHLPFPARSDLIATVCQSGNWNTFLKVFLAISACFRTWYDFYDSVLEYACSLAKENVLYAEIHCTPWNHLSRGIHLDEIARGLLLGIREAQSEYGINLKIIFDLMRGPTEDVSSILDWVRDLPRSHFVALGISGGPGSLPLEMFKKYCEQARDMNLGVVAHAGELEGSTSVRKAVECLKVDRICHGIRTVEDPVLLRELIAGCMHFEICPTSNYALITDQSQRSAIMRMLTSGAQCSINTDDELLFNTSLTKELYALMQSDIIGFMDILQLQKNAALAAFMNTFERETVINSLATGWAKFVNSSGL